ncbi:hypothetical protein GMOD_00000722 [Pyrenophora seminiperda CCB06]|uniref:Uncharacterized protein n=1 Tax=Pyrenophora seminiperda CCB06 TaxID=1302712 RepID=A0A3M7M7Z2_9PLEO|nr:hypothetical protein GMOD_00000722 [Pyrenophora seminiperda CCB06]
MWPLDSIRYLHYTIYVREEGGLLCAKGLHVLQRFGRGMLL